MRWYSCTQLLFRCSSARVAAVICSAPPSSTLVALVQTIVSPVGRSGASVGKLRMFGSMLGVTARVEAAILARDLNLAVTALARVPRTPRQCGEERKRIERRLNCASRRQRTTVAGVPGWAHARVCSLGLADCVLRPGSRAIVLQVARSQGGFHFVRRVRVWLSTLRLT